MNQKVRATLLALLLGCFVFSFTACTSDEPSRIVIPCPSDALVIDLNNDGFSINELKNGVYFDLDGDGLKEKTAWVSDGDGLLVLDLNKNGKIDNGSELLGDDIQENGEKSKTCLEELLSLDKNKDGSIDAKDEAYETLGVWQDINHNGTSEEDELKSLADYHIQSINLSDIREENRVEGSSILKTIISYEKEVDGEKKTGKIREYLFIKDRIDVIDDDLLLNDDSERAERIKKLPSIRSFGKIRSLHNMMYLDKSDSIIYLVEAFQASKSIEEKDKILDELFIELAGAKDVDSESRGPFMDARKIVFLEKIFNQDLEQGSVEEKRARFYQDSYSDIKSLYYSFLVIQTSLKNEMSLLKIKDEKIENIDLFNLYLMNEILISPEKEEYKIKEASRVLMYFDSMGNKGFDTFKDYFGKMSSRYLRYIAEGNFKQYKGTENQDNITVYSDDATVLAGDGDDSIEATFKGRSGNDYLIGGKGNDTIRGGKGSDIYFFNLGDGEDTIYEVKNEEDINVIAFGVGIEKENISIQQLNEADVLIGIKGHEDKVVIKDQLSNNVINKIYFYNGGVMIGKKINEMIRLGSDGAEHLSASFGSDSKYQNGELKLTGEKSKKR